MIHLHGKGGHPAPRSIAAGIIHLRPGGNSAGWGGFQWMYYPEEQYARVRTIVSQAADGEGCARVVVHGFSNGASAAAALYCRGETLGGRAVGYLADDPVPDHAVEPCHPPASTGIRLYTTGALSMATDGWSCARQDWTCEGGTTIGLTRFAQALGTPAVSSVNTTHREYEDPPEYQVWLR